MDRPIAALIKDLKQRGLLDETLIICGGNLDERRSVRAEQQGRMCSVAIVHGLLHHVDGRRGVKGGFPGATDELGFSVTENKVHIHTPSDHHAPARLRSRAIDLSIPRPGLRLTDVHGHVVTDLLA